jgi:hypothetical protein
LTFSLYVQWADYGSTVEPTYIEIKVLEGGSFDLTMKYRPGNNGTPWYSFSGSAGTVARFFPQDSVATHAESTQPNVQVHAGPYRSSTECFTRVNLY